MKKYVNKYTIAVFLFVIWMLFFDKNDVFTQIDLNKQLKKMYEERKYYQTEIIKNKTAIEELKNNIESVEKYAREQYWMKRKEEDVYVILQKNKVLEQKQ